MPLRKLHFSYIAHTHTHTHITLHYVTHHRHTDADTKRKTLIAAETLLPRTIVCRSTNRIEINEDIAQ